MKVDDRDIIACLDRNWRSMVQVRGRLGVNMNVAAELADSLERLANAGKIERSVRETAVPKRYGGRLSIRFYRRLDTEAG